ncbi:hypothetical protein KC571_02905, partial [candidate division WWE3 bacterium]|nr:hypothetical protein [candidate division WWE3 bacterium]
MPTEISTFIKKHKLNTLIILIILACLGILLAVNKYQDYQLAQISTFDECARAGYPILESYPPQCKTPDGRTFIGIIQQQECAEDAQCGNGYYCLLGACEPFIVDTSCNEDADCTLINTKNRYSCCWSGQCDTIDYTENTWI